MTRRGGEFSAHLVPAEVLSEALTKPTVRAESVLDGIFAQSVVVVESDGDRLVYQTVLEVLSAELHLDVHLATVGGIGGIADTCKLYRTLKIPVAIIADLDMITDKKRLRRVLEIMTSADIANDLSEQSEAIMDAIKKLPPNIDLQKLRHQLGEIVASDSAWNVDSDIELRRKLNRLAQQLDRLRRIKRGGLAEFPPIIANPLNKLLNNLSKYGVFLVPVGELEGWLSDEGITESKEIKCHHCPDHAPE